VQPIHWLMPSVSGSLLLLILTLTWRRQLREEYALLWLGGSALMVVVSLWPRLLEALGLSYTPHVLLVVVCVLTLVLLQVSVAISTLKGQVKALAQQLALLQYELNQRRDHPSL